MEQINPAQNDQIIQTSNENSAVETTTANQLNTIIDQSTAEIKYVGFWSRLLAFTIDIIILITLSLIIQVIYIDTILKYLAVVYSPDYNFVILKLVILALWIYHIYRTCRYGATLGKVILGLKVVSNKSKKNKLIMIITRETLGKFLSLITIFGFFLVLFTKKNQALHDKIADTVVICCKHDKKILVWFLYIIIVIPFTFAIAFNFPEATVVICSTYLISIWLRRRSVIAAKKYSENLAPIKDMMMSEVVQSETLIKLLDEKRIIRMKDMVGRMKAVQAESNYTVQEYIDIKQSARAAKLWKVVKWIAFAIALILASRWF